MDKILEKLKDKKVLAAIIVVVLGLVFGFASGVKEVTLTVCRQLIAENPAPVDAGSPPEAPGSDLK